MLKKHHFRRLESDRCPCYKGAWICQVPCCITDFRRISTKHGRDRSMAFPSTFGSHTERTHVIKGKTMTIHILFSRWQLAIDWCLFLNFYLCIVLLYPHSRPGRKKEVTVLRKLGSHHKYSITRENGGSSLRGIWDLANHDRLKQGTSWKVLRYPLNFWWLVQINVPFKMVPFQVRTLRFQGCFPKIPHFPKI